MKYLMSGASVSEYSRIGTSSQVEEEEVGLVHQVHIQTARTARTRLPRQEQSLWVTQHKSWCNRKI